MSNFYTLADLLRDAGGDLDDPYTLAIVEGAIVLTTAAATAVTIPSAVATSAAVPQTSLEEEGRIIGVVNGTDPYILVSEGGEWVSLDNRSGKTGNQIFLRPVYLRNKVFRSSGAPVAMTTAATISTSAILGGLITGTHTVGGTAAYTLPTGAVLDAADPAELAVGDCIDFTIINLSAAAADTITLTAPASGITIVGKAVIESQHSSSLGSGTANFRLRKTAADTYVCYRI